MEAVQGSACRDMFRMRASPRFKKLFAVDIRPDIRKGAVRTARSVPVPVRGKMLARLTDNRPPQCSR